MNLDNNGEPCGIIVSVSISGTPDEVAEKYGRLVALATVREYFT